MQRIHRGSVKERVITGVVGLVSMGVLIVIAAFSH
jgi:hypothetical protein